MLGHLSIEPLSSVVHHCYRHQHSGELHLRHHQEHMVIHLDDGRISNITDAEDQNLFSQNQQIQRLGHSLLWREGAYSLKEKVVPKGPLNHLTNASILFQAGRSIPYEDKILESLGGEEMVLCFVRDPILLFQTVHIDPEAFFYISRIQPHEPIKNLLKAFPSAHLTILQLLYGLVSSGILEVVTPADSLKMRFETPETIQISLLNLTTTAWKPSQAFEEEVDRVFRSLPRASYYELLELEPDAPEREIYHQYLQKIRRYHPDKASHPRYEHLRPKLHIIVNALFQAYQILTHIRQSDKVQIKTAKSALGDPKVRQEIVKKNMEAAKEYIQQEEWYSAWRLLEQAHRFAPHDAEVLYLLATVEKKNPRWHKKLSQRLLEFLEDHPEDGRFWTLLGDLYRGYNLNAKARDAYRKALQAIHPDSSAKEKLRSST